MDITELSPGEALRLLVDVFTPDSLQSLLVSKYGPEVTSGIFAAVARALVQAANELPS